MSVPVSEMNTEGIPCCNCTSLQALQSLQKDYDSIVRMLVRLQRSVAEKDALSAALVMEHDILQRSVTEKAALRKDYEALVMEHVILQRSHHGPKVAAAEKASGHTAARARNFPAPASAAASTAAFSAARDGTPFTALQRNHAALEALQKDYDDLVKAHVILRASKNTI